MSFYNQVINNGFDPYAKVVFTLLPVIPAGMEYKIDKMFLWTTENPEANLNRTVIPRFRDAYFTWKDEKKEEPVIVILTRTGGPRREEYIEENEKLRKVVGYIRDEDDEFDNTFALFYYEIPSEYRQYIINDVLAHYVPLSLREQTMRAVEALKDEMNDTVA